MKLILPDGTKLELDNELTYEEKKKIVEDIVEKWQWFFTTYRNTKKTTVCLEVLSNYLCNHKEKEESDDNGEEEVKNG